MDIHSVSEEAFRPYGRVVDGLPLHGITAALEKTPLPEQGTLYKPKEPLLHAAPSAEIFARHLYGGMPAQLGWCNGRNAALNCLEYHRSSEFNLGTEAFILLVARRDEILQGRLHTSCTKAFLVPAGVLVELYATTLHYAPCHVDEARGFRVLVALPEGTNEELVLPRALTQEDRLLRARNKWLLAHPDAPEAAQGAYVGLAGENIRLFPKTANEQGGE